MRRCSRFSPTASHGRVRPWRWRSGPARAPCSERSNSLAIAGKVQSFGRGRARPLDDPAGAGIHDNLVTPRSTAERLEFRHEEQSAAEILREYGPFPGVDRVNGVTFDGQHVWFARGDKLNALDPASGKLVRSIEARRACRNRLRRRSICFRSPRIASTRSIRRPAASCHDPGAWRRRRLRPRLGRRHALGRAASRPQDPPDRSRDRRDPSHHRVQPRSSPASPGSTASSGTAPGKATRAMLRRIDPANGRGSGACSRCRRERACRGSNPMAAIGSSAAAESSGKVRADPPAQPRLRGRQRLHEQVVEAALAGGKPCDLFLQTQQASALCEICRRWPAARRTRGKCGRRS